MRFQVQLQAVPRQKRALNLQPHTDLVLLQWLHLHPDLLHPLQRWASWEVLDVGAGPGEP